MFLKALKLSRALKTSLLSFNHESNYSRSGFLILADGLNKSENI